MATRSRPRHPMPADVEERLLTSGARSAYERRPAYQRNDYLIWIEGAKTPATREKRIRQMIGELERGDVYMNMAWQVGGEK